MSFVGADSRIKPPDRNRGHVLALDGVRGVAIALVMTFHFTVFGQMTGDNPIDRVYRALVGTGWVGVDLFFALSGFLITGILYDARTGAFFFRNFYARRILRIFPLYYGFLTVYFVVFAPAMGAAAGSGGAAWYWTYTSNVLVALRGWSRPTIDHFWSLAVEEQFYLIWPWLVFSLQRRSLIRLCIGALVLALGARTACVMTDHPLAAYALLPCRADALAAGALVALLARGQRPLREHARSARRLLLASLVPLIAIVALERSFRQESSAVLTCALSCNAIASASLLVLVLSAAPESRLNRALEHPALRFLGKYSYGLYVIHQPLAEWMQRAGIVIPKMPRVLGSHLPAELVVLVGGFSASIVCALFSWGVLESQCLKLKRYFEYRESRLSRPAMEP